MSQQSVPYLNCLLQDADRMLEKGDTQAACYVLLSALYEVLREVQATKTLSNCAYQIANKVYDIVEVEDGAPF